MFCGCRGKMAQDWEQHNAARYPIEVSDLQSSSPPSVRRVVHRFFNIHRQPRIIGFVAPYFSVIQNCWRDILRVSDQIREWDNEVADISFMGTAAVPSENLSRNFVRRCSTCAEPHLSEIVSSSITKKASWRFVGSWTRHEYVYSPLTIERRASSRMRAKLAANWHHRNSTTTVNISLHKWICVSCHLFTGCSPVAASPMKIRWCQQKGLQSPAIYFRLMWAINPCLFLLYAQHYENLRTHMPFESIEIYVNWSRLSNLMSLDGGKPHLCG